ncbi:MAG: extracellular solute-binding protein [Lachnospiraceae bacterium]|nr:extracellular solute-binding protein [Lachnospiraceae bacterium]
MKKKTIAIILALCFVLGAALTGCGGDGGETTKGASADTGEKVKLTVGLPQNANVSSYTDNAFTKYLEEKANVELDFVYFPSTGEDYVRKLTLMAAAGEEMPDVLWGFTSLSNNSRNEFGDAGYLLDLTDLIEEYAPDYKAALEKLDDSQRKRLENRATSETGAIYGMPLFGNVTIWDDLQAILFINQDWLDTLGMKAPETVDELYTVLKAFKEKDPNGNGIADEIPMFGRTNAINNITTWVINAYVYYNDTYNLNVTDGKLWAPYTTDEYRQALIFLNKLCEEGLLSDLSFSAGTAEMKAMVTPATGVSQVGIWAGHPSVYADQTSPLLEEYTPYSGLLKDETGLGGHIVLDPTNLYFPLMITADCEYPEAAMRFCNVFYQDETISRQRHGEKGVDWIEEKGELTVGGEGYIKVVNPDAFFKGNKTWCANGGGIYTAENYLAIMASDSHHETVINGLMKACHDNVFPLIVQPEERCEDVTYTSEQYETSHSLKSSIVSYTLEQRNLFILGTIDINDDAQWNNYLSELDRLGQQDYLSIMQEVYDSQENE